MRWKIIVVLALMTTMCGGMTSDDTQSGDAGDAAPDTFDAPWCECSGGGGGLYSVPYSAQGPCGQPQCETCGMVWAALCSSVGEWECVGGQVIPTCDGGADADADVDASEGSD